MILFYNCLNFPLRLFWNHLRLLILHPLLATARILPHFPNHKQCAGLFQGHCANRKLWIPITTQRPRNQQIVASCGQTVLLDEHRATRSCPQVNRSRRGVFRGKSTRLSYVSTGYSCVFDFSAPPLRPVVVRIRRAEEEAKGEFPFFADIGNWIIKLALASDSPAISPVDMCTALSCAVRCHPIAIIMGLFCAPKSYK